MHEAGRAFDYDLSADNMTLTEFWVIAKQYGLTPIISAPKDGVSESWHFDCRGSHDLIYQHYKNGKGTNFKPYAAMAASAILSIGVKVDKFGSRQTEAAIQSALIRLGFDVGDMDGQIGRKTMAGLDWYGVPITGASMMLGELEDKLRAKFPGEFA